LKYAIKSIQGEKFQDREAFVDSTVVLVSSEASAEMILARSQAPSSKHKKARAELTKNFDESYDDKLAAWSDGQKYIDADSMDLTISRAEAGDATAIKRARQTLDAAIALIDPVWGGVFQYSEGGSWSHPHFEKIMSFQAQYLRQYS